jgi:hypothetical protein
MWCRNTERDRIIFRAIRLQISPLSRGVEQGLKKGLFMGWEQSLALIYILMVAAVILFQLCLIFGAPWGKLTQGGSREGALLVSGRGVAAVSILVLLFMAAGILSAVGLPPNWARWTGYTALAIQGLSALLNWMTPSESERRLWRPITTLMLALAVGVVLSN